MKSDYLQVRISDDEKTEITDLVNRMGDPEMSVSRFVRDAIREKATREKKKLPTQEPATATAQA